MRFSRWIETVDTHTEGQATRIITGGLMPLKGKTLVEKMEYFQENLDHLRTMLIAEPRPRPSPAGPAGALRWLP